MSPTNQTVQLHPQFRARPLVSVHLAPLPLYPTLKSDRRLPSHSSTTAVHIHAYRRFFHRLAPTRVHISSNEIVFTRGLSEFIPRIFLADVGRSDAAGLRSERSASIAQPDKSAFLTHRSTDPSFISIALPIAATLDHSAYMASVYSMTLGWQKWRLPSGVHRHAQSPQRYICLPGERPSLGIRLDPQRGRLMSCRQARRPAIFNPFQ